MRSIATYPLAALCGLAMVASLFLKWIAIPPAFLGFFGVAGLAATGTDVDTEAGADTVAGLSVQTSFGPMDLLEIDGFSLEMLFQDPIGIAIAASFLLAAAVAILGFLAGTVPRLFAVLAGLLPFGIVGWSYLQFQEQLPQGISLGDVIGSSDLGLMDMFGEMSEFMGAGIYAYFGGAILLLLLGLFSPSKREAY